MISDASGYRPAVDPGVRCHPATFGNVQIDVWLFLVGANRPDLLLDCSTSRLLGSKSLDVRTDGPYTLPCGSRSRGVAQLVARGVWDAEVGGSSPSTPTLPNRDW